MKKGIGKSFIGAISVLVAFALWTVAVQFVDVAEIGPNQSLVGFSTVNRFFHNLTGVSFNLYIVTDWLGLVPVFFCFGFAILGLIQWIKRKHLSKVDYSILVLGGFYIVVIIAYLFFEGYVVNYRPILINGYLEASYPSSTTLLVLCVMPTAVMQLNSRIKPVAVKRCITVLIMTFTAFMVIGRLLSGVHWLTDIIGGMLLSTGFVMLYHSISGFRGE